MNEEILKPYIRKVTKEDKKKLPTFSYSKMEVFKTCPFQYDKKYNGKMRTNDTSIALELGSLCHYVLEMKGKMLQDEVDYDFLKNIEIYGADGLLGTKELKKKYWEEWYAKDNASGMNYDQKMKIFDDIVHTEMETDNWTPFLFEHSFEFVWNNRCIIHGFIDRVDKRGNDFKVIDYKTSKKVYDQSKLSTSLQFGIYCLAILNEFGALPVESMYRFILIDEHQYALTRGWEKRLIKAIEKILDSIDLMEKEGVWNPKPCPLCHWCNFSATNPNATTYKHECDYYSLWTPTNKTFKTNKIFNADTEKEKRLIKLNNCGIIEVETKKKEKTNNKTKRKLVF